MADADEGKQKAWQDCYKLQQASKKATHHHLEAMAKHIRKGKRKDGEPIKKRESEALANSVISTAANGDLEEMTEALLEARKG